MRLIYHPNDVKKAEKEAILSGDDSLKMIGRAAHALLDFIYETAEIDCSRVLIVAGKGNNGADGLLLGALLASNGSSVTFYKGNDCSCSEENLYFSKDLEIASTLPCDLERYTLIVDALYGIGFHGCPQKEEEMLIERLNASGVQILSVDLPSGVDGATGVVEGAAVKATYTCALNCYKIGHLAFPGAEHCGKLVLLMAGIPMPDRSRISALTENDLLKLPKRPVRTNKGSFGKVAVVAGSYGMAGAAYFAAKAALLSGAGLVEIYTPEENRVILHTLLPEAILHIYGKKGTQEVLLEAVGRCSSMILGPGLGKSEEARNLVSLLLKNLSIPAIVDADGLNLSANTDLLQNYRGPLAITPHPGEAARLLRKELKEITENPLESCKLLSEKYGCTVLLKDAHTLILTEERLNINLSGNNGMATAGSGDVLSGIVGALLAQGLDVHDAACFGAFIHGLAGDHAAKKHGKRSVTASRVLENIEETLKHLD